MRNLLRALFLICASYAIFGLCDAMAVGPDFEGTAEFTTRPRFEVRGQYTYLILTNQKHSCELLWAMDPEIELFPVRLDTTRVYVFSLTNRVHVFRVERRESSISRSELCTIRRDGRTIYDIAVCEVHKTRMEPREVPIVYGLFRRGPDEPSAETERQSFPHCNEYSLGGCAVGPVKTERIYVCPDCKKAYDKWRAENKGTR